VKHRPLSIIIIAIIYLLEPVGTIAIGAYVNQMPFFGPDGIFAHLLWSDWLLLVMFPVVAAGIYSVKRWGWYLFVAFSVVLIGYNIFVYLFWNQNYSLAWIIFFIVVITAISAVLLRRQVNAPYFNPRLRWWEIAARYKVTLAVRILTSDHGSMDAHLLDLSESGCFVDYTGDLDEGSSVWLVIRCGETEISCLGRLIRKVVVGDKVKGYGIIYQGMSKETVIKMKGLMLSLKELGGQDREGAISAAQIPSNIYDIGNTFMNRLRLRFKPSP
jgi:PilZ domain